MDVSLCARDGELVPLLARRIYGFGMFAQLVLNVLCCFV